MKKENFDRATEIQNEISHLDGDKKNLQDWLEKVEKKKIKQTFFLADDDEPYEGGSYLNIKMVPIPLDNFIRMYFMNIDNRIKELQTEFDNL